MERPKAYVVFLTIANIIMALVGTVQIIYPILMMKRIYDLAYVYPIQLGCGAVLFVMAGLGTFFSWYLLSFYQRF